MSTYTWAEFKTEVLSYLSEGAANDTDFVAVVTDFVRARIARDIQNDLNAYPFLEKKYNAGRKKLAGYAYSGSTATLRAAVRVQLSDGSLTSQTAAQAVAYYMRAELAREVDARGRPDALSVSESCRRDYLRLKVRLAGFSGTTQAAAEAFLPVDTVRENTTNLRAALAATAIEDLAAFGTWIDAQIATAVNEIDGINDRIGKELRAAVIDLQHFIRAYQTGHEQTYGESDVEPEGMASRGDLPENAQLREAYIRYPGAIISTDEIDDEVEDRANELPCAIVAWSDRLSHMVATHECGPQIAIDSTGTQFLVTPALVDQEIELRIVYDGLKLEYNNADSVPFDEEAVRAVGYKINAELAAEWGESIQQIALWAGKYTQERSRQYLKHKRRAEVHA